MLLRQWKLVQALHGRRRGMRPAELMEAVGTKRPTLYRDLGLLEEAGVPIAVERINGEARYSLLGRPLPALAPTAFELAALRVARTMLGALDGTALVDALDQLLARFGAGPDVGVTTRRASGQTEARRAVVRAVDAALRSGRRLRFDYRDGDGRHSGARCVDPVALRHAGDQLYLVAWDVNRDDWRVFKIARMTNADVLPNRADSHPDYDEDVLFGGSVKAWHGEPVEVAIRLSSDVAWKVEEWPLVPEQRLDARDDGSAIVRAEVQGIVEASRWVLSWGGAAEALEPSELREAVREELATALSRYSRPGRGLARTEADWAASGSSAEGAS